MEKKIVIIGAGTSGIAAGVKLIENGFTSITWLEAENRLGGRVNTIPFGSSVIDLGAQWCHGQEDNAVYELAKDKNVFESDAEKFRKINMIRSDGSIVPPEVNARMMELHNGILESEELTSNKGSVGDYYVQKYNEALQKPEFADIDAQLREEYLRTFEQFENGMDASESWFDLSSARFQDFLESEGDFNLNWKDNGYATLFDILTKKFEHKENYVRLEDYVKFAKEAVKVTCAVDGTTDTQTHPIRIECSDGSVYEADHVICSVSLGVLKERHQTMFSPPLSPAKIESINGIGFGTVGKVFLEFEQPFWPENWNGAAVLWKADDLKSLREDEKNKWLENVTSFFPVNRQKNLLEFWMNSPGVKEMEKLSEAEIQASLVFMLRKFLKDFTIPEPVALKRTQWFSNPHFRGSYSYYAVQGDAVNASRRTLAEPVSDATNKPVVQFCGEATNETHFSTVHGAMESGWREADRLINLYK